MISFIQYVFSFQSILSLSILEPRVLSQEKDAFDVGAKGGRETLLPPAPQS